MTVKFKVKLTSFKTKHFKMSLKSKPECLKCEKSDSPMWANDENGVVCLQCSTESKVDAIKTEPADDKSETTSNHSSKDVENGSRPIRRSTRSTRYYKTRLNPFALPKTTPKGKGRRVIFKKTPMRAPTAVATPITSDSVFYKGSYVQVGDIMSLVDEEENVYYAQIRGLLTDQYCEKSAVLTWLLPTEESPAPNDRFDPATYIIGPDEEIPRKLDSMEFIMHAPSDYFRAKNTPYPLVHAQPEPGFIWTSLYPVQN